MRQTTITKNTTRGLTTSVVRRGTVVSVLAARKDPDGLKLLVRIGTYGRPFQVRADVTDYIEGEAS